jgi:hypothetical protein
MLLACSSRCDAIDNGGVPSGGRVMTFSSPILATCML